MAAVVRGHLRVTKSACQNIVRNLALEDSLLNHGSADYQLLLWENRECVVLGRNQVPWMECDPEWLRARQIPLLRRFSGGGCVYHDLGNSNYSLVMPRGAFDRSLAGQLICDALPEHKLRVNSRFDIERSGVGGEWAKVSGSAFRFGKARAYHHGTFLRHVDIARLHQCLTPAIVSKADPVGGVASVRARLVANVPMTHEEFCERVIDSAKRVFGSVEVADTAPLDAGVEAVMRTLASDEWTFGASPEFTFDGLSIRNGRFPSGSPFAPSRSEVSRERRFIT